MSSFSIKAASAGDHLTIHVLSPPQRTGNLYEDWVQVIVAIKAGGFNGHYDASFLTQDFPQLHSALERLYNDLTGSVTFQAMEGQLEFEIKGDGQGHFQIEGAAVDQLGSDNRLHFSFEFDQTFIPQMLRELSDINVDDR